MRNAAINAKAVPTSRYSGRIIAVAPNSRPGTTHLVARVARGLGSSPAACEDEDPCPATGPARGAAHPGSDAQRNARTAAGRVKIAAGSLNKAPVEWMNGG
jgi:hypothetical protein